MNRPVLGARLGLAAGVVDVLFMLPMKFPDKPSALAGAFFSRFAIGFLAANVRLPFHPALVGVLVGLLISIPDAIITKAYIPILVTGVIFGALAGWAAAHAWGARFSDQRTSEKTPRLVLGLGFQVCWIDE